MATSVRSLSNHYESLRVAPTATMEEIAASFSERMRAIRHRPDISVALLGQLSLAYETLRDPARRKAYDQSLGLKADPTPPAAPAARFAATQAASGFSRTTAVPQPTLPSRNSAGAEPRLAAFIASSLREPVKAAEREVRPDPVPEKKPAAPAAPPQPTISPTAASAVAAAVAELRQTVSENYAQQEKGRGLDRNRATMAAGALGIGILALALALPGKKPEPQSTASVVQPSAAVTVGLPPAEPARVDPASEAAVATAAPAETPLKPRAVVPPPSPAPQSKQQLDDAVEAAVDQASPTGTADEQPAAEPVEEDTAAASTTPAPVAAKLPLANATIARTIERIGYACGSVVSSSPVDGAAGVFKITCSSGASYQASPVRGRYHFRRLGNR